jgi:hypothetical protein
MGGTVFAAVNLSDRRPCLRNAARPEDHDDRIRDFQTLSS